MTTSNELRAIEHHALAAITGAGNDAAPAAKYSWHTASSDSLERANEQMTEAAWIRNEVERLNRTDNPVDRERAMAQHHTFGLPY